MNFNILIYLISINLIGAVLFFTDKRRAIKKRQRISERTLHIFEFLGAVFSIVFLMYSLRHKNRKISYYLLTFLALMLWVAILLALSLIFMT